MGVGSENGGIIELFDMDKIESTNLSRQFLYRENDIGKFKSEIAAKRVASLNHRINIIAHNFGLSDQVESSLPKLFWENFCCYQLAVDTKTARNYIGEKSAAFKIGLINPGTEYSRGNVHVYFPNETSPYQKEMEDKKTSIAICTLKFNPTNISHTIAWALDLFSLLFGRYVKVERPSIGQISSHFSSVYLNTWHRVNSEYSPPKNEEESIRWSKLVFETYFNTRIACFKDQEEYSHVIPIEFDATNQLHNLFLESASKLFYSIGGFSNSRDRNYLTFNKARFFLILI